ncbi:MAG: AAA family ATPase [Bacteroidetes bacterium]|uniref:AAA family ATPase n=1 Tax=Candidatus Cryptobacteroides intestinigallinarum TaxID=2840767 RepID=A0A9D9HK03_9BACT|nr:AAA family ATPase [Candidatus Cryptobacteroides intestinigallinarum]
MKESIKIHNLGPIKELTIDDIRPATFFIGASASGKSTILKAIALFRYLFKMLCIRSYLKDANISRSPFRIRMESLLRNCGFDAMINNDTYIEYSVFNNEQYVIKYANKKLTYEPKLIKRDDLVFFKVSFISESRNIIPIWASRIAANRGARLGFYFHETFNDFNEATDTIKELEIDYFRLKMNVRKTDLGKRYLLTPINKENAPFELTKASSGMQSAIPLSVIARYFASDFSFKDAFRRSVLNYLYENDNLTDFHPNVELADMQKYVHMHIEEPEVSADPATQIEIIDSLAKQCFINNRDDRSLSFIVATHSPYIINELNVLIHSYSKLTDAASINPQNIDVYKVIDGHIESLIAKDNLSNETIVNAIDMSETMDNIYQRYINIGKA